MRLATKMTVFTVVLLSSVVIPLGALAYFGAPKNLILSVMIGVLILGCVAASIAANKIMGPMTVYKDTLERLANEDVSVEIPDVKTNDEFGELARSFKRMVDNRKSQAEMVQKLAMGNLDVEIIPQSKEDILAYALIDLVTTLNHITEELTDLGETAAAGTIMEIKSGTVDYSGSFKLFMDNIKNGFKQFLEVMMISNKYIFQIGAGIVPGRIDQTFPVIIRYSWIISIPELTD